MAAVPEDAPVTILPGATAMIPTGLALALPPGFEGQVRPRSGLAAKHGVTVLNSPGTIDADYRGEVAVLLINHGRESFLDHARNENCSTNNCHCDPGEFDPGQKSDRNRTWKRRIRVYGHKNCR